MSPLDSDGVQQGATAGHLPLTKIKPWCASQAAFSPLQSPTGRRTLRPGEGQAWVSHPEWPVSP